MSCLNRNGEITGYIVEAITSGEVVRTVNVNDSDARRATVTGLNSSTQYTVEVAAVNSAGTGPFGSIAVQTQGECGCCLCKRNKSLTALSSSLLQVVLSVSVNSLSTTSLSFSWGLEQSLTATSYAISYSPTNIPLILLVVRQCTH